MTDRLYYTDAYVVRFRGRLAASGDDGRRVYLDRSAFYPTSGGQPNDMGRLGGVEVVDVVDEGERVAHLLAAPLAAAQGDEVEGEVDWPRRFDHMQQHTGQHLLSAVFEDRFGWATLGVHFGPDYSTLDLDTDAVSPAQVRDAEERVNALVAADLAATVSFEEAGSAAGLRKASDRSGTLRIVSIDGVDRSACGGTHVRRTGEIGAILLRRQERVRRATRIEFACGLRAVRRARADYEALAAMANGQSCAIDELPAIVAAQVEQLKGMEGERKRLDAELAAHRARARYDEAIPDASGVRWATERRRSGRVDESRSLALAFCALPRAVYIGVVDEPPSLLVAASGDSGVDAGALLKGALAAVGGRGGGSPRLAQGTVPGKAALDAVLASLGAPRDNTAAGTPNPPNPPNPPNTPNAATASPSP